MGSRPQNDGTVPPTDLPPTQISNTESLDPALSVAAALGDPAGDTGSETPRALFAAGGILRGRWVLACRAPRAVLGSGSPRGLVIVLSSSTAQLSDPALASPAALYSERCPMQWTWPWEVTSFNAQESACCDGYVCFTPVQLRTRCCAGAARWLLR
jgi:hypothetical protein